MESAGQSSGHGSIVWTNMMSTFVLKYLAELIASGTRMDKGFKQSQLHACAMALNEHLHLKVTGPQVSNHLKKWKKIWKRIDYLKKKTGVIFDEESCMITMSTDQYMQHVQDYPGDENFINTPLEHYSYLATVFGNMMATGAHAKATTEALAPDVVNEDPADDHVSVEPSIETSSTSAPSKNVQGSGSSSDKGKNKRAREDSNASIDPIVSTITDSLKLLANAISSSAQCLPVDLWDQVQCLPGFSELEKTNFYIYLSDRPSLANAFSKIPLANKVIWMDKFTHEDMP